MSQNCFREWGFSGNETYESLANRLKLYEQIKIGLEDIEKGNTKLFNEAMDNIRDNRKENMSMLEAELNAELEKGYADMIAGRVKSAKHVFDEIRQEYDLASGSKEALERNEQVLHLREKVLQAEQERIDGVETISILEARKRLRERVGGVKGN